MSDELQVTTTFNEADATYTVVGRIINPVSFPTYIFLHENNEGELGEFFAVCTKDSLSRPIFEQGMSSFGVKLVRYDSVTKTFSSKIEAEGFETSILVRTQQLATELTETTDTVTVYPIL